MVIFYKTIVRVSNAVTVAVFTGEYSKLVAQGVSMEQNRGKMEHEIWAKCSMLTLMNASD